MITEKEKKDGGEGGERNKRCITMSDKKLKKLETNWLSSFRVIVFPD